MLLKYLSKSFSKQVKDYYKILNVQKDASPGQIKRAYVKFAFDNQFSTERKELKEKINNVAEAYQVLSDKNLRQKYDEQGPQNFNIDNKIQFKGGEELFKEKLKIPNFFEISSSHKYQEYSEFNFQNGKTEGEVQRRFDVDQDGERVQREQTKQTITQNGKQFDIYTTTETFPDGTKKTKRTKIYEDEQGRIREQILDDKSQNTN